MPIRRVNVKRRSGSSKRANSNTKPVSFWEKSAAVADAVIHARHSERRIEPDIFAEELLSSLLNDAVFNPHRLPWLRSLSSRAEELRVTQRHLLDYLREYLQGLPDHTTRLKCLAYLESLAKKELEARRGNPDRLRSATRSQLVHEQRALIMLKLVSEAAAGLKRQLSARR